MALRLIEMVLQEKDGAEVRELFKEHKVLDHKQARLPDGEVLVWILLDAGDGYYLTAISQSVPYEIVSRGYVPMPGSTTHLLRTVKVQTAPQSVFSGALIVKNTINLNGNNVRTDSYDSTDPTKSTASAYDPAKAGDRGDVGCVGGLIDSVNIGNADVWGRVLTGPNGTVQIGPMGGVGSKTWHLGGNNGLEPGWWLNDMNINFPSVQAPFDSAPPPAPGLVDGVNYNYVLGNGNYQVPTLSGKVLVTGEAVLYVPGDVTFKSGDVLQIAPGATLHLYVAGADTKISTVINKNTTPETFRYFGLPSNQNVTISGNASLTSAVYAPDAMIKVDGGVDFYGSVIGKDAVLTGHSAFHYDESLSRISASRAVVVTSWNEI
jgi:hypothetical protein